MSDTPNAGIPLVPQGTLDPAAGLNAALNVVDVLLQTSVISMALTAPPGGETDGDLYIPASPATGAWAGLEKHVLRYVAAGNFWQSYAPGTRVRFVINEADGNLHRYNSVLNAWTIAQTFLVMLPIGNDLTTDITTGTGKAYFRAPYAFTVTEVRASLIDASSSGIVTVDINENGSTILSTKLSIDASENTSLTAATPPVISDSAIADDAVITIDIDNAGTDARGLIVTIKGVRR
jgi:hypothetical protein